MSTTASGLRGANPYLLLTLTPPFWSCNWIVGRGLAADVPPMAMTFFRWFAAALMLAPFAWPRLRREWSIDGFVVDLHDLPSLAAGTWW